MKYEAPPFMQGWMKGILVGTSQCKKKILPFTLDRAMTPPLWEMAKVKLHEFWWKLPNYIMINTIMEPKKELKVCIFQFTSPISLSTLFLECICEYICEVGKVFGVQGGYVYRYECLIVCEFREGSPENIKVWSLTTLCQPPPP